MDFHTELREAKYNVSRAARVLGVNYFALKHRTMPAPKPLVVPTGPLPTDPRSLGRKDIADFAIAVKANGTAWPIFYFNAIQRGRAAYDAGTHEMAQEKRKDGWIVLYLIPRLVPTKRRSYFSGGEAA